MTRIDGQPDRNLQPGWDPIGVVTTNAYTAALVRNRNTGSYCQAVAGALRPLPQHKVEEFHLCPIPREHEN